MQIERTVLNDVGDVEKALNDLQKYEAEIADKTADANREIAELRQQKLQGVGELEEKATVLRNELERWAKEQRKRNVLFTDNRKTLDLHSGSIQLREAPASVSLLKGFTTEDVIYNLTERKITDAVKTGDPTLDKTMIKKLLDRGVISEDDLKWCGLKIEQKETVVINLKTVDTYQGV